MERYKSRVYNSILHFLWGKDCSQYDTVGDTLVPFWLLQLYRLLCFIFLFMTSGLEFYIFVKSAIVRLAFYSNLLCCITFFLLFVGAGRQVCWQKRVSFPEKYGKDIKPTSLWLWAVFFYGHALPLTMNSCFFTNFSPTQYLKDRGPTTILNDLT